MKVLDCIWTRLGEVNIERAELDDSVVIVQFFNDAVLWLASIGMVGQWGMGQLSTDPDQFPAGWKQKIEAGEQYIATLRGRPIGALWVYFTPPPEWSEAADEAGYISVLMVRRDVSGQGIGRALLDWAGLWAARHGRRYLRLACWTDNERLCRYYEEGGFRSCGEHDYSDKWRGRLFQKEI